MAMQIFYREAGRDALSDIRHTHDKEIELVQILSGEGKVFVKNKILPFSGSAVFFIDGGVLHYICPEPGTHYLRNKLIFDKALANDTLSPLLKEGYLYRAPSQEAALEADRRFAELHALHARHESPLLLLSRVFELLHFCTAQMDEGGSKYRGTVADVVRFVHEHLSEGITLADVAQALHVNKHYLCRLFKRETGMTVGEYINSARIAKAKHLLRTAEESVSFVAAESGFNEPSAFTKSFKKEVGMTPTAYKARTNMKHI